MTQPTEWIEDDYPTDAALDRIRTWPHTDVTGCLDFVRSIWNWPDFGVSETLRPEEAKVVDAEEGDRFLRLATGGWSGNESIVSAMHRNRMLMALSWHLEARGGLHIFEYPKAEVNE